jgi:hypothetical protein
VVAEEGFCYYLVAGFTIPSLRRNHYHYHYTPSLPIHTPLRKTPHTPSFTHFTPLTLGNKVPHQNVTNREVVLNENNDDYCAAGCFL